MGEWALAPGVWLLVFTHVIEVNLTATGTWMAQNLESPLQRRRQIQGQTQWLLGMKIVLILGIMGVVTGQLI